MKKLLSLGLIVCLISSIAVFSACEFNANPPNERIPTHTQYIVGIFRHNIHPDWDGTFNDALKQTENDLRQMLASKGFYNVRIEQYNIYYLRVIVADIGEPNVVLRQIGEPAQIEFRVRGDVVIVGGNVISAQAVFFSFNFDYVVSVLFDVQGAANLYSVTQQNIGEVLEIWMIINDSLGAIERLISAPMIVTPITGGSAVITGMGSIERANELANQINAGRLPLLLERIDIYVLSVDA